jgi:hypothetical protein
LLERTLFLGVLLRWLLLGFGCLGLALHGIPNDLLLLMAFLQLLVLIVLMLLLLI